MKKKHIKSTDTIISCINGINMKMVNQLAARMMQDQRTTEQRAKKKEKYKIDKERAQRKRRNETKEKHEQKTRNDYN